MYVEPTTIMTAGSLAFRHRKDIVPALKQIGRILQHGRTLVLVFGPGGTGKTTLGKYLSGEFEPASGSTGYIRSTRTETFRLKGLTLGRLEVGAGQERYRDTDWPELRRKLATGESIGVINVVSWGHHSFTEHSYEEMVKTLYPEKNDMLKEEFIHEYFETSRATELEIIDGLVPHLQDARGKTWMITLVTKQDLWWRERVQVKNHYTRGKYNECIQQIANQRGKQHFRHEYLSASLVLSNLKTESGELLVPTTEGYDQNIQYANLKEFTDTLLAFAQE
jgi:energy-coupling factor transporter ATP-binding protein EcfA2